MINKLKNVIGVSLCITSLLLSGCSQPKPSEVAMYHLVERIMPQHKSTFLFEEQPSDSDHYAIEQCDNGMILISGNNGSSMARGLNQYLHDYCNASISMCGSNMNHLPTLLPRMQNKVSVSSPYDYRYYLNYCTYSYTMGFWGWDEWETELDRMALRGINMPLAAVVGEYAVWYNTLKRLNYTDEEIYEFLPGPGYEAWWLMGNLEGAGGPVSPQFIASQTDLQQKMLQRMSDYGMQPVYQGFYGMVPNSLKEKYPEAHIIEQGKWGIYQRPALLDPNDPLFAEIAAIYYDEQQKLFGQAHFYGGDPFHEGGRIEGVDVTAASRNIMAAMRRNNPDAVWVLQGWQQNPQRQLLEGLEPGETMVLDLMACQRPQWGGIPASQFHKDHGHLDHNWIWCALPNFGGKTGMYGAMDSYAHSPNAAKQHPMGGNLKGIGVASEGVDTNPAVYALIYDMAWQKDSVEVEDWVKQYARYRYGSPDNDINKAWSLLANSVYNTNKVIDGPMESFVCARPDAVIRSASSWSSAAPCYEWSDALQAWDLFYQPRHNYADIDAYQYDLVDMTRQVMADYAKYLHAQMEQNFSSGNYDGFVTYSDKYLQLMSDMDALLSTRSEFMLGRWLALAAEKGTNEAESNRFVQNAKRQITTWTETPSDLRDYANKEWSGLIGYYYLPRWRAYVEYKRNLMQGEVVDEPNYDRMEMDWVASPMIYATQPNPIGPVVAVEQLHKRYYNEMSAAYGG